MTAEPRESRVLLPREHGAWGMLLFPFVSAAALTKTWTWTYVPALIALLGFFVLREPLLTLARERFVWRRAGRDSGAARRTLAIVGPTTTAAAVFLAATVPAAALAALAGLGVGLTLLYVWAAATKRQRSAVVQILGASGLTPSCWLAYLAAGRSVDETLLLLGLTHAAHNAGGVLTVHARLEALQARRDAAADRTLTVAARRWGWAQGAIATWFAVEGRWLLAAALLLPLAWHARDLVRLKDPAELKTPLRRVGVRELLLSAVVSLLTVVALWS